jgi:hypothetical protein
MYENKYLEKTYPASFQKIIQYIKIIQPKVLELMNDKGILLKYGIDNTKIAEPTYTIKKTNYHFSITQISLNFVAI